MILKIFKNKIYIHIQMNFIKIITYLFVFKNYEFQDKLGNDERFPIIEDKILTKKIIENHQKNELLNYLKLNSVSTYDKINKINYFYGNMPKPINILNGGLLDDWNFDI